MKRGESSGYTEWHRIVERGTGDLETVLPKQAARLCSTDFVVVLLEGLQIQPIV